MYELTPEARFKLDRLLEQSRSIVTEAFVEGARMRPEAVFVSAATDTPIQEAEWRSVGRNYRVGSWKETVFSLLPFARFHPCEIYVPHRDVVKAKHPGHSSPDHGVTHTIHEFVFEGTLAKVGPGVYAPAVKGVPII